MAEAPRATNAQPSIEVHEWGLLAFTVGSASPLADAITGTAWPRSSPSGHGGGGSTGSGLEPVMYIHVPPESPAVDVEVRLAHEGGFRAVEQWPPASDARLRGWSLRARRGSCAGRSYPTRDSADCATADGICEAAVARAFETTDAACLEIDGAPRNHLFYRAVVARPLLPIDAVERRGVLEVVRRRGSTAPIRLVRVVRGDSPETARLVAFDAPATGSLALPPATPSDDRARASFFEPARTAGLTSDERAIFERIWKPAVFGGAPIDQATAEAAILQSRDALYYFLPAEDIERILPVTIEPRPSATRRAIVVRIALERPPHHWTPPVEDAPHVTLTIAGTLAVAGGRSDSHRRVVYDNQDALIACAERAVDRGHAIDGRSTVRYTVDTTGHVASAAIVDDSILDPTVTACIEATFLGLEFPVPTGPTAIARVPLAFRTHGRVAR